MRAHAVLICFARAIQYNRHRFPIGNSFLCAAADRLFLFPNVLFGHWPLLFRSFLSTATLVSSLALLWVSDRAIPKFAILSILHIVSCPNSLFRLCTKPKMFELKSKGNFVIYSCVMNIDRSIFTYIEESTR